MLVGLMRQTVFESTHFTVLFRLQKRVFTFFPTDIFKNVKSSATVHSSTLRNKLTTWFYTYFYHLLVIIGFYRYGYPTFRGTE